MIEFLFKCFCKRLNVTTIRAETRLKFTPSNSFFSCIHNKSERYCKEHENNSKANSNYQKIVLRKTLTNENSDKNGKNLTGSCHLVFMYGTLKKNEPNHELLHNKKGVAVYLGSAQTLKKWPLVIASRYNIPYLLYCEGKGKQVVGEVYEVDTTMLEELDKLECHPKYYERTQEEVLFLLENKICVCWIYFLKNYAPHLLDLPFFENYSSNGPHGLKYVERFVRPEGYDVKPEVLLK